MFQYSLNYVIVSLETSSLLLSWGQFCLVTNHLPTHSLGDRSLTDPFAFSWKMEDGTHVLPMSTWLKLES